MHDNKPTPNSDTKTIDWTHQRDNARKRAAWKFCKMLDQDADLRARCTKYTPAAKALAYEKLKQAGQYTNMPDKKTLTVYVFERQELAQNPDGEIVVMILPPKGQVGDLGQFNLDTTWIAGWNHWNTTG